jgi:8-oxo-dGTP diphosphatase
MSYTYQYPRPAVTADMIVLTDEPEPQILLIQRGDEPFKGCWAFPGGFMNMDETTEQCARRELKEETGLDIEEVQQVGAYSTVDRDPRGRTITVAYITHVPQILPVTGLDDAAEAKWWPINALPPLAFDHAQILRDALRRFEGDT